jgi:uncharacterized protein (DUF305 family)
MDGTPPVTGGPVRTAVRGGWVRRRLGWWLLAAVLAAGCSISDADQRPVSGHTDVWFARHMVPHLLQSCTISDLAVDQLTRPKLARLASTIHRQGQANLQQPVGWRAGGWRLGLPAGPQPPQGTDLSRLSKVQAGVDRAFLRS